MTLPNGKDLAVWCEKPPADLRTKSLWLGYGEGPFEMMEIVGDDEPGSYIQDGAATSWFGVDKEQYELSVGSCPVVLTKEGNPDNTIAVNISVGVAPAEKRR